MTDIQKKCMEDEINIIQEKIDEATKYMEIDNFYGNCSLAKAWSRSVDEYSDQLKGIKIALAVLGYHIGWKDNKQFITND